MELIIAIGIIAIILSIGVYNIHIVFNTKEKRELMEFKRDIIYARNSAVVENSIYILYVDVIKNGYKITKEGDGTIELIKSIDFSEGNIIESTNFRSNIKFYSTGSPSDAGTIKISNRKHKNIKITITPATGKVNLYID